MFYKKKSPLLPAEPQEITTLAQLAAVLSRDGSIWMESAFCKKDEAGALLFFDPLEAVQLTSLSEIRPFFRTLEKKLDEGFFVAGWMSYEAGYGFEAELFSAETVTPSFSPFAWFGVYRAPCRLSRALVDQIFSGEFSDSDETLLSDLTFDFSGEAYTSTIRKIREEIAAGNVYQVNFTGRYRFTCDAPLQQLYSRLRSLQPSAYAAWLNCGERIILTISPELFFRRSGRFIETMPMKGTAPRGFSAEEDHRLREELACSEKNRAENLMIVDLLRNDLGRICRPGSVEAGELFVTETYPTLHQMVSTVRGEERKDVELYELFRALYPSGSITGAPKIKAMKLIRAFERGARGVYTGTIGYMTPTRDMLFNVAIRTLELSGREGIYGSGSGIVWDSDPDEEYCECRLKAKILPVSLDSEYQLFESILWREGYLWLDEHLLRMAESADELGFPWNKADALLLLDRLDNELCRSCGGFKARLALSLQGEFTLHHEPVVSMHKGNLPLRLVLAVHHTDSSQRLLYHKTTARELYDRYYRLAALKGYDEVLFTNERGELSEGAISTVFIRKGGKCYTPPLRSGILNGIFRSYFLSTRSFAEEKTLFPEDLTDADMIYIANSVRGLRTAFFAGDRISL